MTIWQEVMEVLSENGNEKWITAKAIHNKLRMKGLEIRIEAVRFNLRRMVKKNRVVREECITDEGRMYIYKLKSL